MNHGPNVGSAGTPKRRRPGSDDEDMDTSSGYSRSPSPLPPSSPPRRWHRHNGRSYSSSSSEYCYSSSEAEDDRLAILRVGPAERRTPQAFGRKLSREEREWSVLGKNCQFVKKILQDPGLHDTNSRERPTFVTADDLMATVPAAGAGRLDDPRLRLGAQYFEACRRAQSRQVLRIPFVWEAGTSRGPPPPCTVLLTGFPATVISKSLLISLLESSLGWSIQELVKEVQLATGIASLTLKDPQGSSRLVNYLAQHPPGLGVGGIAWGAKFDRDGDEFRRRTAPKPAAAKMESWPASVQPGDGRLHRQGHHHQQRPHPPASLRSRPDGALRPRDGLACDPRVPCVIVEYAELPPETRALHLQEAFGRHHRLYNVERGREGWHVHLLDQRHIDRLREHPSRVLMNGTSPISFSIRLFSPPDRALPRSEWEPSSSIAVSRRDRQPLSHPTSRTSASADAVPAMNLSARHTRSDSHLDLGNLYRPSEGLLPTLEGAMATLPPATTDQVGFEAISDLPSFNRRLLERQRMEEEQAAVAAETARLALEARLETEAARQARRQEKELRRQQRLARKQQEPAAKGAPAPIPSPKVHKSGCARAEGYYAQEPSTKTVFIEDLTRSTGPGPYQSDAPSVGGFPAIATAGATAPPLLHPSSRSNRAQNRRLQSSRDSSITSELLGKGSGAFAARKKQLLLGRSSIHSWGLFAGEDIEAGDMVVEYVGEVIRHSVANVRERRYELALRARGSSDIASSYLFRLSAERVVDATHKGNISRFINHSCDPTCMARILDGRRIIMYARRDIQRGEEITYDYKFPHEDDPDKKIKCLCGARQCRGYLN